MDVLTVEQRHRNMQAIRAKDTKPEVLLRSLLHRRGLRFRKHVASLPGRPDIVLPRWRAVIFVHGCFWHRHEGCRYAAVPATRKEWWEKKFAGNVDRDSRTIRQLEEMGWRVLVVWECELKKDAEAAADMAYRWLAGEDSPSSRPTAQGGDSGADRNVRNPDR